jgi:HEAT repeat protein
MRHVFVSYAREDADFAALVADELTREDFRIWRNHESCAAGDLHDAIDIGIREALAVVTILSPVSAQSAPVNYEWAFALGSGVPVLPVLLDGAEADLHPRLRTLQYLDFSNGGDRPWRLLMQSLHKLENAQRPTTVHVPRDAPAVIQQAARALDGTDERQRAAALASLGQMNHPAVIEVLAEAVRHPVRQVRYGAAIHLAVYKDRRAVPALLDGIRSGDKNVEPWMLGQIGHAAVPALLDALRDENREVRSAACSQLGRIGGFEAIAGLVECLRDTDADKRCDAADGLEYAAASGAIPALLAAARDPDKRVRNRVIRALVKSTQASGSAASDGVLTAFIEALDDEYDQVGIHATEGLAHGGDQRAIAALVRAALTNQLEQVRGFSRKALLAVAGAAAPVLRQAVSEADPVVLYRVISLLSEIHDESDFPLFIEATRHEDDDVRKIAVIALWDNRVKEGVPALIARLNDDDEHIRELAARALGEIRDPRAAPALIRCLNDDEEDIAEKAAGALESIATKEAWAALKAWKNRNKK